MSHFKAKNLPNSIPGVCPFVFEMEFVSYWSLWLEQGSQVETAINKFGNKEVRWSSQGMIRLTLDAMKRLFEPTVERIKLAVSQVASNVPGQFRAFLFSVLDSRCIKPLITSFCLRIN